MKHTVILSILCVLIPLTVYADDSFNRIGVMIGGISLVSFSFEHHFGGKSLRVNVGTSTGEISISTTLNGYFTSSDVKVFTGIGEWSSIVFYKGIEHIHLVTVPVGVDWKFSERKYLGLECDMHYFITGRHHDGRKVTFNSPIIHERFLPMPALYYKIRL